VRRALNLAVDRSAVVADWPSVVTPTCQVLPPGSPGYRPYCPYTLHPNPTGSWSAPDFVRAQKLVAASGTRGMHVTLRSLPNVAPGLRPVVRALRDLGYRVTLKLAAPTEDYFGYVEDSRHPVQAAFFGWIADAPSAGDFLGPIFACDSFRAGTTMNTNFGHFCDARVDRLIRRATRLDTTSRAAANAVWAQVDRRITDLAAWVSLVNGTSMDAVSRRVHNYQRNPFLGPLLDQMWLR
jgi:peptide/nickel transport system substrate-binding protein